MIESDGQFQVVARAWRDGTRWAIAGSCPLGCMVLGTRGCAILCWMLWSEELSLNKRMLSCVVGGAELLVRKPNALA